MTDQRWATGDSRAVDLPAVDLRTVYQPVVDLDTGDVVAHEALTRGPAGPLQDPLRLLDAARRDGSLSELDARCRTTAVHAALRWVRAQDGGAPPLLTLFLNAEPEGLGNPRLDGLRELADLAGDRVHVVLEITERSIAAHHAQLLETADRVRALGWAIALDDVGASADSLAFLPLLDPDVVKLDVSLVQGRPSAEIAQVVHAVNDYAERRGTVVLAEGIETPQHLHVARALGARLGQGWMFGRPERDLRARDLRPRGLELPEPRPARPGTAPAPVPPRSSPFADLPADVEVRRGSKDLLLQLARQLEDQAAGVGGSCVVVTAFQHARHFTPVTARRYHRLAASAGFVYVLGEDLPLDPASGLHVGVLAADDPLCHEWDVAVLAPHFHAALLARDLGEDGPDLERRFEYAVTYRHDVVVATARSLLSRATAPAPAGGR